MKALARRGWRVTTLAVDASGIDSADRLREAITDDTALVSVMHANNEIGTIQPIAELAAIAHEHGALFHTDAVQSTGKIPVDVRALGVDLATIAGHKLYGPKGTGALWIKRGVRLLSPLSGGRQERNRRAGTENVPALVGFGVATEVARRKLEPEGARLSALRDRLEAGILSSVPGAERNGAVSPRVPNTTNLSIDRVESESLLIGLDLAGIAVSSGSACSSGTLEPSHVLKAMGLPHGRTLGSIRFSLGAANTDADIDRVIAVLPPLVEKLRSLTTVGKR
jgi:cysteine desulfurase